MRGEGKEGKRRQTKGKRRGRGEKGGKEKGKEGENPPL